MRAARGCEILLPVLEQCLVEAIEELALNPASVEAHEKVRAYELLLANLVRRPQATAPPPRGRRSSPPAEPERPTADLWGKPPPRRAMH